MQSTFRWLVGLAVLLPLFDWAGEPANLARNPGFERTSEGWALPPTFAVVSDVAHQGARSLRLVNTNPATYLLARQSVSFQPGLRYRYGAWIRTRGVKGDESGATLCVEWSGAQGWLGGSYADGKKGDQDWFRVEEVTGPIPTNATSVAVELYLRKGMTGTAWFDDVTVVEEYPPALDCVLLRPNYRGRLAAGATDQRVLVRASVGHVLKDGLKPERARLQATIRSGARAVAARTFPVTQPGYNDLELEGAALPAGDYQVRVALLAPDGARLASQELDLRKLPPDAASPTVYLDEHNRTLVNGKPFFPLGWYFGPGPTDPKFPEHIDRLAASPFNTLMCYGVNSGDTNTVRAYLDYLARRNVKIIYSIKDVYEGTRWYHEPVLGWRGEESIVRHVVESFRDHPALLGWYLNDELPLTMRDRLQARQRFVSQLDPNHPTWAVLYQVDDLFGYLNTADVLGTDPYPVPDRPVTVAAEWTRKSQAVSQGCKPLWMVPQAFDWASYRHEPGKGRPPTLDEERVMTYLCLIHGAHGLIYYSYADLLRDPKLGFDQRWADLVKVGREVKQLEPALLSVAPPPPLEVNAPSSVHHAVRSDDRGKGYVLLANPAATPATVRVTVPKRALLRLLEHGEDRSYAGGGATETCTLTLAPMGALTLMVQPSPP